MAKKGTSSVLAQMAEFMRTADEDKPRHSFKTRLIGLNHALGKRGCIPGGSIVQLIGEEKTGKSTLSLEFLAVAQTSGIKELTIPIKKEARTINAAYVDFERSFDREYAELLGVDVDKLILVEADYGEQGFVLIEHLLAEGLQFVIIDSVAMFVPESENDKTLQDNEKMASSASVLTRAIKRLIPLVDNANAMLIIINQYRANMSPMARSDKKPFGARVMKYGPKLTIDLTRISNEDDRTTVKAHIAKSKITGAIEGRTTEYDLVFGEGIDYAGHVLALAKEVDVVLEPSKGRYIYGELKAHGAAKAKDIFPMDEIACKVEKILAEQDAERDAE